MYRVTEKYITPEEMVGVVEACQDKFVCFRAPDGVRIGLYAYIEIGRVYLRITTRYKGEVACWTTRLDGVDQGQCISGMVAYTELAKAHRKATGYRIPIYKGDIGTAKPLLTFSEEYNGQRVQAWGYDMNSAYGWAMCQPMPDCRRVIGKNRTVEDGEIGFIRDGFVLPNGLVSGTEDALQVCLPGEPATTIFKVQDSPFKHFAEIWYDRKVNAKTKEDKARAKQMLNYSVGYLQRKNPFLRAAVVDTANRRMLSLIDDDTIFCNTDSIVSLRPREDLIIGTGLGEFKIEHTGDFAYKGFSYQWGMDVPSIRGVSKSFFDAEWDLLKDELPMAKLQWVFDPENLTLRRIEK